MKEEAEGGRDTAAMKEEAEGGSDQSIEDNPKLKDKQ